MWREFGFRDNPYTSQPVPASADGDRLLVGREREIARLTSRILAGGNHPTVEGDNGVGKTSLLSVVTYRLRQDYEQRRLSRLFIPLNEVLQPNDTQSVDEFIRRAYMVIASTIVDEHDALKRSGANVPDIAEVKRWLQAPILTDTGVSVSVLGSGFGGDRGRSPNTSAGFAEFGFQDVVDKWLRQLFPSSTAGGIICVLDNMELLDKSQEARRLLEGIRDPLFGRRGLHWVLCGARGIVRTAVSSPRLEGRLADPMDVLPLKDEDVVAAVEQRIALMRETTTAVAPVGHETFKRLYDIVNRNLRIAFKYAGDFSQWLVDEDHVSGDASEYAALFDVWFAEMADKHHHETDLRNRAWQLFDSLADGGGSCSPGDFARFGFNSAAAMRTHVKALEQETLVYSSVTEDEDRRRRTIVMTPRAWLVRYARAGYRSPVTSSP
jgi:hypothetical protein